MWVSVELCVLKLKPRSILFRIFTQRNRKFEAAFITSNGQFWKS